MQVYSSIAQTPPQIVRNGSAYQLIVNGKPFLMRAGELGNSNASTIEYYKDNVVRQLVRQKINTALVPVYWHLIEPKEGVFDFKLVGDIIKVSAENDLKVKMVLVRNFYHHIHPKILKPTKRLFVNSCVL